MRVSKRIISADGVNNVKNIVRVTRQSVGTSNNKKLSIVSSKSNPESESNSNSKSNGISYWLSRDYEYRVAVARQLLELLANIRSLISSSTKSSNRVSLMYNNDKLRTMILDYRRLVDESTINNITGSYRQEGE